MAWRNRQGFTGSNNIPLGTRRGFGADGGSTSADDGGYNPSAPATGLSEMSAKRGRSPERAPPDVDGSKRRRRRNRWGEKEENKVAGLMGLPTAITGPMTQEQIDAYVLHVRIEEITKKIQINDYVPASPDRTPSPPPQYDNFGRRTNTREFRYRKKLEDERHKLVEKAMKDIPGYKPPADYRRPTKTQEKVYVPVNDYPEINFIGLLIGPRGNTLKKMESQSGAKIAIRGKGSVKEGKGKSDAAHTSNQEEDLHCLIMADTEDKVNKAKQLIHNVIETAASIPEGQNELKRNQLRELAALNGTLRDDENQACQNCGEIGHRKFDCPQERNFTASIICRSCGNSGHMARDCPDRDRGTSWRNDGAPPGPPGGPPRPRPDNYEGAMNDITGYTGTQQRIEGGPGGYSANGNGDAAARPWAVAATGGPAPWQVPRDNNAGGARPWAQARPQESFNSYGAPPPAPSAPGVAPWQRPAAASQPTAPGYTAFNGFSAAPAANSTALPPPGLGALFQNYGLNAGSPPPPPPSDIPPPPAPPDLPPPPPPPPS